MQYTIPLKRKKNRCYKMCFLVKAAASGEKTGATKMCFLVMITGYDGRRKTGILCPNFGVFFICAYIFVYC